MKTFVRAQYATLQGRLQEPRRSIQAIIGPRQVGKTTMIRQLLERMNLPHHFATADTPNAVGPDWISQQWAEATKLVVGGTPAVLVLDEVQKVSQWSESVKLHWDEDTWRERPLHVVVTGSSLLLIHSGLTESLAGRFELLRMPHWSFREMKEAFGWHLEKYIYFGGFPGSEGKTDDIARWKQFIQDSMIEPMIGRDVLLTTRVAKPALLRRLVGLACEHSGQALSYTKMLGQLQNFGNSTTMAHYLDLLAGVGMVSGLRKFSIDRARQRGSSPKLQVWNTALQSAFSSYTFETARQDPVYWGRLVESAVGTHLLNTLWGSTGEVFYWADGKWEVDFVLHRLGKTAAIEVKTGRVDRPAPGLTAFTAKYPAASVRQVGPDPANLEAFFSSGLSDLL
ncbi:MAG: AAA family ATPase [Candidatus Eisenbacteria bacterium]|nr:AAA family ATPase [Candidatus Eisenbacteria bacterium]